MHTTPRARPLARATNAGVGTSGAAFAAPTTLGQIRHAKIKVDGDAYVGVGKAPTAPAASASNSAYLDAGEQEVWTLDLSTDRAIYVYVYAVAGTVAAKVSWYG